MYQIEAMETVVAPESSSRQPESTPPLRLAVVARTTVSPTYHFGPLFGVSPAMKSLYETIRWVASANTAVLVLGESGSGKELAAHAVHENSRRCDGPFLSLACGAIPAGAIEKKLFGHETRSMTGENRVHKGHCERAQGGTLFIDEISRMPLELQVRLLHFIETGQLLRVGGNTKIPIDVRIVAATHCDPRQAIAEGRLHQGLIYHLCSFPIRVPPLRERDNDAVLLARVFAQELNEKLGVDRTFSGTAEDRIATTVWRGNVRELRNVVQRAFFIAGDGIEIDEACIDEACIDESRGLPLIKPPLSSVARSSVRVAPATSDFSADLRCSL